MSLRTVVAVACDSPGCGRRISAPTTTEALSRAKGAGWVRFQSRPAVNADRCPDHVPAGMRPGAVHPTGVTR